MVSAARPLLVAWVLAVACTGPPPARDPDLAAAPDGGLLDLPQPADLRQADLRVGPDLSVDPMYACTSMDWWTLGNLPTPLMHPGVACLDCHERRRVAALSIAGTVYTGRHEPDDCAGRPGVTVEITDATGKLTTMTTNSGGNFATAVPLTPPFRARVRYQGREAVMRASQMTGDCNSCHTEAGANGAPGRIVAP